MNDVFSQFSNLTHWQIDFLTFSMLLAGVICAVFPEDLIIATLGYLWSKNRVSFLEALFTVQAGLFLSNTALVWFSRWMGNRIFTYRPFCWFYQKAVIQEKLRVINQYSFAIIFITRFTPLIRGAIYAAAGLSKIKLRQFIVPDLTASFIQVPLLLWIGSSLSFDKQSLLAISLALSGITLVLILGFLFVPKARTPVRHRTFRCQNRSAHISF